MPFIHNLIYILLMTNIFGLTAVLIEDSNTSGKRELIKKASQKLSEDKKIMTTDTIIQAKKDEVNEKQGSINKHKSFKIDKRDFSNSGSGLTMKKPVQKKDTKKVLRTNKNVIDFNEAKEIKKQESDSLKKQPLKKLVWHFPE